MRRLPIRIPNPTLHAATSRPRALDSNVCSTRRLTLGLWPTRPLLAIQQQHATFFTALTPRSPNNSKSTTNESSTQLATSLSSDKAGRPAEPREEEQRDPFDPSSFPKHPFRFDTGIALFAKRPPRPFPPPFLSPPSGSFSDPLSTHDRSRDRRAAYVDGQLIQGYTNGDDAVFASDYFICANDGVGAWSTRPRGHAG